MNWGGALVTQWLFQALSTESLWILNPRGTSARQGWHGACLWHTEQARDLYLFFPQFIIHWKSIC